jgi:hypothetical protein
MCKAKVIFSKNVTDYLANPKRDRSKPLEVGNTPNALLAIGAKQLPVVMNLNDVDKCLANKTANKNKNSHELTVAELNALPKLLANPVMMFKDPKKANYIVVVTDRLCKNGNPLIAVVELNAAGNRKTVHRVVTMYGKEAATEYFIPRNIADGSLIAFNKEKAPNFLLPAGLRLPEGEKKFMSFDNSIPHTLNSVKEVDQNNFKEIFYKMDFRKLQKINSAPSLLGYGCMRFPTLPDGSIDERQSLELLQAAADGGVNYFDTAYIYHNGKSEEFTGRFLKRLPLPRDRYYVATKLPTWLVESLDDAKRIFAEQLERLQVDYIDFYMLHDLKFGRFEKMERLGVYDYCRELQAQGKIRHFGHSSHENIDNFTKIVNAREWDFIMLHLNYMDMDNYPLYELCAERGIPVLAMETIKGGSLANFPDDILAHFTSINPCATPSSWALRWAGALPEVKVILSGMSDMSQVHDNINTCSDFSPLGEVEMSAIEQVRIELRKRVRNDCTGCNYCMPCPLGVNIPWCLSIWNNYAIYENRGHSNWEWSIVPEEAKPHNCTACGKCLDICPQNIDIIADLKRVQQDMEAIKW